MGPNAGLPARNSLVSDQLMLLLWHTLTGKISVLWSTTGSTSAGLYSRIGLSSEKAWHRLAMLAKWQWPIWPIQTALLPLLHWFHDVPRLGPLSTSTCRTSCTGTSTFSTLPSLASLTRGMWAFGAIPASIQNRTPTRPTRPTRQTSSNHLSPNAEPAHGVIQCTYIPQVPNSDCSVCDDACQARASGSTTQVIDHLWVRWSKTVSKSGLFLSILWLFMESGECLKVAGSYTNWLCQQLQIPTHCAKWRGHTGICFSISAPLIRTSVPVKEWLAQAMDISLKCPQLEMPKTSQRFRGQILGTLQEHFAI